MIEDRRYISWMRWQNPMGEKKGDEYTPEKEVKEFDNDLNKTYGLENDFEEDNEETENVNTPIIITPIGIIPLKPFNDPSKVFNFWLGETNFSISEEIAFTINEMPGVEILDVFTRYKFRIAIGNNFSFQTVRQNIEQSLDATPPSKNEALNMPLTSEAKAQVQQIIQIHLSHFKYWAIYILPNGKVDMSYSNEASPEFNEKLEIYLSARRLAGGAVFKFDEQLV
jgi:hypothetical protein